MWWTDARGALAPALTLAAVAALTSACSSGAGGGPVPEVALTPTQQYSASVEETADQVGFTARPEGLSLTQKAALVALVGRWRESPGAGDLVVRTPSGADVAVTRSAGDLMAALQAMGVPAHRVRSGPYDAAPGAPILASYTRLEAVGPDCSIGNDNFTSTKTNGPTKLFGCAVTANFAAQIADPRHLLAPANTDPPDAARRNTVLTKYRAGEITSTPSDQQATGAISTAVPK